MTAPEVSPAPGLLFRDLETGHLVEVVAVGDSGGLPVVAYKAVGDEDALYLFQEPLFCLGFAYWGSAPSPQ